MAYWLFKSEPGAWSWSDQIASGDSGAEWDGVRNHQAGNNMKNMSVNDRGFFYHSVNEKQIVGIVEVIREWYLDPSDPSGRFGMVDVRAIEALPEPVTLSAIKGDERLKNLPLIRQARLSVMPIDEKSWKILCKMGGLGTY